MTERLFLIFRLAGPMAAFGSIAVGEYRAIWDAPSKSGVMGFIAAGLGIPRADSDRHQILSDQIGFAARIDRPGTPLRDYHTAQAPKEVARNKRRKNNLPLDTRRDDLACDDLNTVLSERFYRLESAATIALWVKPGHQHDLATIAHAIKHPCFTPYLGRKACPLGLPPCPDIITASGLVAGFDAYDARILERDLTFRKGTGWRSRHADLEADLEKERKIWFEWGAGLTAEETEINPVRQRRDAIRHRALWHFTDRQEGCLSWQHPTHGTQEISA